MGVFVATMFTSTDDPGYAPRIAALDALFARCQRDDAVSLAYDTLVVCGQLTARP